MNKNKLPERIGKFKHFPLKVGTSVAGDLSKYPEGRRLEGKGYALNEQRAKAGDIYHIDDLIRSGLVEFSYTTLDPSIVDVLSKAGYKHPEKLPWDNLESISGIGDKSAKVIREYFNKEGK